MLRYCQLLIALNLLPSAGVIAEEISATARASLGVPVANQQDLAAGVNFQDTSHWRVSLGASYRNLGGVSWNARPVFGTGDFGLPQDRPTAAGSARGFHDRFYDDGFVRPDSSTSVDGNTGYWGYRSNSQVQGDYLTFHSDSGITHTLATDALSASHHERLDGVAPVLQVQWTAMEKRHESDVLRLGILADASFLSSAYDHQANSLWAQWRGYQGTVEDRYNLGGIAPPGAPYTGDTSGSGHLIPATPESRTTQLHLLESHVITAQTVQSLDLMLTSMSFGTSLEWQRGERYGLLFSTGLTLNAANWDAKEVDTLRRDGSVIGRRQYHASDTELLVGFFLQTGAEARVAPHLWMKVFGRYDWSQSVHATVAASSVKVDPSGWTVGASAEWRF